MRTSLASEPTNRAGGEVLVVVNPAARSGAVGRRYDALAASIERASRAVTAGAGCTFARTEGPGHAEVLAERAARRGVRRILSVGGDGTHGAVAHGIVASGAHEVAMGPLPAGTGGDFARMLPARSLEEHVRAMLTGPARRIDLGRVRLVSEDGDPVERTFLNVASVGLSGLVDRAMTPALRRLGGKLGFFVATVKVLTRAEPPELAIELDGAPFAEGRFGVVTIGNGRFAGGGMQFAPSAELDDGRLDVSALGGDGMTSLLSHAPALYSGAIASRPSVITRKAKIGRISPLRESCAWVDVDGENPGRGPLDFEVLPGAIGLLGAS